MRSAVCLFLVAAILIGVVSIDASRRFRRFGKFKSFSNRFRSSACGRQPCIANGVIKPTGSRQFTYTCNTGFELKVQATCRDRWIPIITCQGIDECASSPCLNNGTCRDRINGFTCNCPAGFTGDNCETNIDDCAGSPCSNYGTCIDGINTFTCNCPAGFTGDNCETNIDDCMVSPCLNNGTCTDRINGFSCSCLTGFTGADCGDKDECWSSPCLNGGTCIAGVNNYTCNCASGYTGATCGDCMYKDSLSTNILLAENDAVMNNIRDINRTACEGQCNDNENCTAKYFTGACFIQRKQFNPYYVFDVNFESRCKEECEGNNFCSGYSLSSTCALYKEPLVGITYNSTLDDCKAQCFNRIDCVSLTLSGGSCYLFNNNTDNLVTKYKGGHFTVDKLC